MRPWASCACRLGPTGFFQLLMEDARRGWFGHAINHSQSSTRGRTASLIKLGVLYNTARTKAKALRELGPKESVTESISQPGFITTSSHQSARLETRSFAQILALARSKVRSQLIRERALRERAHRLRSGLRRSIGTQVGQAPASSNRIRVSTVSPISCCCSNKAAAMMSIK